MAPSLATKGGYGVALIGDALRSEEVEKGLPFVDGWGYRLTRLIEWAGLDRDKFDIFNTLWCVPPQEGNRTLAVGHCRQAHWEKLLGRNRVLVPMGDAALEALTGRGGVLTSRGYVRPGPGTTHIIPTFAPSFLVGGQAKYSAAVLSDLQKAVRVAREGLQVEPTDYTIDPTPSVALAWAAEYRRYLTNHPEVRLAYDIETPGKKDEEDDNDSSDEDDNTYFIYRIGFSYLPFKALTVPWSSLYLPAIKLILGSEGEKIVWNAAFDNPRIRAAGVDIKGTIHDGMIAWHILHTDQPKGLGYVATFTCPGQHEWKNMSQSHPGLYNCIDADVELRSMLAIERELKETGLWGVYEKDVLELDPILHHMQEMGMPVDREKRLTSALELEDKSQKVIAQLETLVPQECRTYSPKEGYVKTPKDTTGLILIRVPSVVRRCSTCLGVNPPKSHFKTFKRPTATRPQNPCSGASIVQAEEVVERYARLDEFKLSRNLLLRYQHFHNRIIPTKYDKKTRTRKATMDEKAIKRLIRKYPLDPLYPLVLEYRELDKLAGTYIGRPLRDC